MLKKFLLLICFLYPQAIWAEVVDISVDELRKMLATKDIVIVDVRTPKEWRQTGIVESSVPIMFFDEKGKPHAQHWMSKIAAYVAPDDELILICRSGNRSRIIANYLSQQHGFRRIYNVKNGIKKWLRLGLKTVAPN